MEELEKQVGRARWRLGLGRFLRTLGYCCFATLLVAAVLVGLDKRYDWPAPVWVWPAAALGLGLVGSGLWIWLTRRRPLDAAIEIDKRFGLKERVSSTIALSQEELESEAGHALVDDAVARVRRVEVAARFPVRPGRPALLPLVPLVLGVLAFLSIPAIDKSVEADTDTDTKVVKQQVKRSGEALKKKLAERRKEAGEKGLKDAERLFKRLERQTEDLASGKTDRKKARVQLNDLAQKLQQRRSELGGSEQVQRQLNQLRDLNRGPADDFAKAVRDGDFKKAEEELDKLKEKLDKGELDEKDKQELKEQLDKMQDKLNDLAAAHKAACEDLKKKIDQAQANGQLGEAGKLQQQLNQLMQQAPQMNQLQQMANQLGQCAQCMQNGNMQGAQQALQQLQGNLADLQQQLDEMELLDEAMNQLVQAQNQMNCKQCGGKGCGQCQGGGNQMGNKMGMGQGQGKDGKQGGMGLGAGQGQGARPDAEVDADFVPSHVRQKLGPGEAVVAGQVEGPLVKGDVEQKIQEEFEATKRGATDPLTNRRIPRGHRQHVREYFERFKEGK
jgi:hypothetical protein